MEENSNKCPLHLRKGIFELMSLNLKSQACASLISTDDGLEIAKAVAAIMNVSKI